MIDWQRAGIGFKPTMTLHKIKDKEWVDTSFHIVSVMPTLLLCLSLFQIFLLSLDPDWSQCFFSFGVDTDNNNLLMVVSHRRDDFWVMKQTWLVFYHW